MAHNTMVNVKEAYIFVIIYQQMVDDLKEREAKLESTNRKMNQRVLELEAKLEEAITGVGKRGPGEAGVHPVPRVPGSREELELKLAEANKKVRIFYIIDGLG